jgi:uncharacterized protein YkwD
MSAIERRYIAACGRGDERLSEVAQALLLRAPADGLPPVRVGALQHMHGNPQVWPRVWQITGHLDDEDNVRKLGNWLVSFSTPGELRCGVASAAQSARLIVVAAEALADLEPFPVRVRTGTQAVFRAHLLVGASRCALHIQNPSGSVQKLAVRCADGVVAAPITFEQAGAYRIQLIMSVAGGPRPALEAEAFADVEPYAETRPSLPSNGEDLDAVLARINDLRRVGGQHPLVRRSDLDRVAQDHAERMRDSRTLAHDAGDGLAQSRLAGAGFNVLHGAENVAFAPDLAEAQDSLEESPSHFDAMMGAFDSVGIGMALDESGRVYLTEIFAVIAR